MLRCLHAVIHQYLDYEDYEFQKHMLTKLACYVFPFPIFQ
jgi:hypothetical protein